MKQVNNKVCDIYLQAMTTPLGKAHKGVRMDFRLQARILHQLMPRRTRIATELYDLTTQLGEFEI